MRRSMHVALAILAIGAAVPLTLALRAAPATPTQSAKMKLAGATFSADGKLQRPVDYRNWRFVSAGLGMSYGPAAQAAALSGHVMFDNVFVQPEAYDAFLRDRVWPEGTVFVLELRGSETQRPPNNRGYLQTQLHGIEVSVKDSARFENSWAYFDLGMAANAAPMPESACFACHRAHAAEDMTFVQFYPTLQNAQAP